MSGPKTSANRPGGRDGQYPAEQVPGVEAPGRPHGGSAGGQYPDSQIPGVEFSTPVSSGDPMGNSGSLTQPAATPTPNISADEPGIERSAGGI